MPLQRQVLTHELLLNCSKFKHHSVRDLAWLLLSPALLNEQTTGYKNLCFDNTNDKIGKWLSYLDDSLRANPQAFPTLDRSKFRRLGLYAEALMKFIFTEGFQAGVSEMKWLAQNVQFVHQGRTVGEIDFLLKNNKEDLVHLELAVKYYLLAPSLAPSCAQSWIGPNTVDRLDIKTHRLTEHQLPLLKRPALFNAVKDMKTMYSNHRAINPQAFVKGVLFAHWQDDRSTFPDIVSPDHISGTWAHVSELQEYFENNPQVDMQLLSKMAWMGAGEQSKDLKEIISEIQSIQARAISEKRQALACLIQTFDGSKFNLLMIVNDHWPL